MGNRSISPTQRSYGGSNIFFRSCTWVLVISAFIYGLSYLILLESFVFKYCSIGLFSLFKLVYISAQFLMQSILMHPVIASVAIALYLLAIYCLPTQNQTGGISLPQWLTCSIIIPLIGCLLVSFMPAPFISIISLTGYTVTGFRLWLVSEACIGIFSAIVSNIVSALIPEKSGEYSIAYAISEDTSGLKSFPIITVWLHALKHALGAFFNIHMIFFNPLQYPTNIVKPIASAAYRSMFERFEAPTQAEQKSGLNPNDPSNTIINR